MTVELDHGAQYLVATPSTSVQQMILRTGAATGICMMAAIVLDLVLWIPLDFGFHLTDDTQGTIFGIAFLIGHTIAGGYWGRYIARITQSSHQKRMMAAGALIFVPTLMVNYLVLPATLKLLPYQRLPIYHQYKLFFLPFVFIVATVYTAAIGLADGNKWTALRHAIITGLGSTVAFLIVVLIMDMIGYRVGARRPGLWPPLPPMPFVTLTATLVGACIGGGIFGWCLHNDTFLRGRRGSPAPGHPAGADGECD